MTLEPSDLGEIASRYSVKERIDWKSTSFQEMQAMPYEYFRRTRPRTERPQACEVHFESVDAKERLELSFYQNFNGLGLRTFEAKGKLQDSLNILEVMDGELILRFNDFYISGKDKRESTIPRDSYIRWGRFYLENSFDQETQSFKISKGHLYKGRREKRYGKRNKVRSPLPLQEALPWKRGEKALIEQAYQIDVSERYHPFENEHQPGYWSTLSLRKEKDMMAFNYQFKPLGSLSLPEEFQIKPKTMYEALQKESNVEHLIMSNIGVREQ